LIALEELYLYLWGELGLEIPLPRLSREFVDEFSSLVEKHKGNFILKTTVVTEDEDQHNLESELRFFPSNALLEWLEERKYEFSLKAFRDEKND